MSRNGGAGARRGTKDQGPRTRDQGPRGAAPLPEPDATVTNGRRWLYVGAIVVEAIVLVALWLVGRYFTNS